MVVRPIIWVPVEQVGRGAAAEVPADELTIPLDLRS
jgi:hypothetical protein